MSINEKSDVGYILEVDLKYPDELHELHNDYPLAPEKLAVTNDPPGFKTSWQRRSNVSLYVPVTSQVRLKSNTPRTSRWNIVKTSQWCVSKTSYWNVITTSQKDVTTTPHHHVSTTPQTSLK